MTNAVTDASMKKGGAPVSARPSIQDLTMLKVAERPFEGKAKQESLDFLYEGFCRISPLEMHRILNVCAYEHQRAVSDRHVAVLADLMTRGKWQPKGQIDFAVLDGNFILINGYHRGYAQVRSGKTIEWSVVLHQCKSADELRSLYFAFDTNIRIRGSQEILRANEFADTHGLPKTMANSLYNAVPFIASRFAISPKDKNFLAEKQIDRRLEIAAEYAKPAARYAAVLEGVAGHRKKKFMGGAVTAVAVITFRYQSATAWEFWSGVVNADDGILRGDPRRALANDMLSRAASSSLVMAFAPPILAWNAFYNDKPMKIIKIMDSFVPAIDGTPFDGKRGK